MLRILVIDDESAVRDAVSVALRRAGHEPVPVRNGQDGLAALQNGRFDAVVTDMFMPQRDGIELILALRSAPHPVPVLAMSGGSAYGADGVLPMARMLGAEATLRKPFLPSELVAAVEAIAAGPA